MKSYESANAFAIKKSVKKARSKAGFVGTLYLLGALALASLACLPLLTVDGTELSVLNFYAPFATLFEETVVWMDVIVATLYALLLLIVALNFFKCFSKFGWLLKKSSRNVHGYNRNTRVMEDMGKRFSSSFSAIVSISFCVFVCKQTTAEVALTLYGYVTVAVALFVHFFAGFLGGTVSWFGVYGNGGNVREMKRECGKFVYFFRNLVQLASVVGIAYFFLPKCTLGATIESLLGRDTSLLEGDIVTSFVPVLLQALILSFFFGLVKHATSAKEFNRLGVEGEGMKTFRVFSFLTFLTAGGAFAVEFFLIQPETLTYEFAFISAIAFVAFLVDCICKSRSQTDEEGYCSLGGMENQAGNGQGVFGYGQYPAYGQATGNPVAMGGQNAPNGYPQPIYIPVYYPYPQAMPAPTESTQASPTMTVVEAKPTPAPAPVIVPAKAPKTIQPTPAPMVDREDGEPVEIKTPLNPNKEWRVRCPRCGKQLIVRETSPYHRCPSCDKVFEIRKFQAYVRKDEE